MPDSELGDGSHVCGNGVKESGEECDDGTAQNTGGYGKCNSDCTLGPHCGDGKLNGMDEACDNGADNGLALGNCNPACTGVVRAKTIRIATGLFDASSGFTGELTHDWDGFCAADFGFAYKALIVDHQYPARIATIAPNKGDGQMNWVLKPYTRYINTEGDIIWTTDSTALLGVRAGTTAQLQTPLLAQNGALAWSGFNDDWTLSSENCKEWGAYDNATTGRAIRLDKLQIQTVSGYCNENYYLVCVEQ